jgi:hypothetical protein
MLQSDGWDKLRFVLPGHNFNDEKQKIKRVPERHNPTESRCK